MLIESANKIDTAMHIQVANKKSKRAHLQIEGSGLWLKDTDKFAKEIRFSKFSVGERDAKIIMLANIFVS